MDDIGAAQNRLSSPAGDAARPTVGYPKGVSMKTGKKAATAFRTISEVADDLGVQQHVLRFWETKFTQIKPLKRGGGRRYYRPEDVAVLQKIHHLLYGEGYTIKGVQKLLKGQGKQQIVAGKEGGTEKRPANNGSAQEQSGASLSPHPAQGEKKEALSTKQRAILEAMLGDLKELRDMLKNAENP